MLNIKFFVDSTSDIPHDYAKENDIGVFGMPIIFDDGTAKCDWTEMLPNEFYEKLETSKEIPTTSQIPMVKIDEAFREALKTHDAVVYFTLSSKSSGTYQTANMIKNDILEDISDAKIEIVDSMAFSMYIMYMVVEAVKLTKEGKSLEEVVEGAKNARCMYDACVIVDTLKYLEKGGRINKASLIAGSLLDLKPVLSVRNGLMESIDKFRGRKTVIRKMVKKMLEMDIDLDNPQFMLANSQVQERQDELWKAVNEELGEQKLVMSGQIGATVGTHIGPGTLGIFFRLKNPKNVYED